MLIFVPLAVVAEFFLHNELLIFLTSALALIPLAGLLGEATEELAIHTGPRIGGLLNATLGNAAELIITIVALQAGKFELIKASLTGSIIGNLLLILGFALFLGGLRNGVQRFDPRLSGMSSSMMFLAVIGLIIPTLFELLVELQENRLDVFETGVQDVRLNIISLGVAGILIVIYALSLLYQLRGPGAQTHAENPGAATAPSGNPGGSHAPSGNPSGSHTPVAGIYPAGESGQGAAGASRAPEVGASHSGVGETEEIVGRQANWSISTSLGILAVSTLAIVFMSEFLVGVVEPVARALGVRELFLGVIVIPIVGNVAEHLVGVQAAIKNQMDLSMTISFGSSTQIALFVAPLLVFISLFFGPELTLFFSLFEVAVLLLSVIIASLISVDGESNWIEGAMLLGVYAIVGLGFFYL
jgi:Ca2+:H+ antiporter